MKELKAQGTGYTITKEKIYTLQGEGLVNLITYLGQLPHGQVRVAIEYLEGVAMNQDDQAGQKAIEALRAKVKKMENATAKEAKK